MSERPPSEFITLQIDKITWQFVEQVCPMAKQHPTAALVFMLGIASGLLLRDKHEQEQR